MNSPESEQFEHLYRRVWAALQRHDASDLSQHQMQLLHHVPSPGAGAVPLNHLAQHLALPKSTASTLVKDLERRGFLRRSRDPDNERQLAIVLTPAGAQRVAADTVLDPERLAEALRSLSAAERRALLAALERLATTAERSASTPSIDRSRPSSADPESPMASDMRAKASRGAAGGRTRATNSRT